MPTDTDTTDQPLYLCEGNTFHPMSTDGQTFCGILPDYGNGPRPDLRTIQDLHPAHQPCADCFPPDDQTTEDTTP